MSLLQSIASFPGLLHALRVIIVASLIFISGLSLCLSQWVVPNMYLVPPHLRLQQLVATFSKGEKTLLPGGRILMVALITNVVLTAYHPDSEMSARWKLWATIGAFMILTAPFETIFIFPINNRAKELKKQIDVDRQSLTPKQEQEVQYLITRWASTNYGRVFLPLIAGLVGLSCF